MKDRPEKFSIIKQAVSFQDSMYNKVQEFYYGAPVTESRYPNRGLITYKGFNHLIKCIEAMTDVLGDKVGLALDCGPGMTVPDALKLAKAVEGTNIVWLEDNGFRMMRLRTISRKAMES